MATLTINGRDVQVDDSFLKLSPADQEKTVNEIAGQMGVQPQQQPAGLNPAGIASQGLSGVNEGIAGTLGFPVDVVNGALRAGAAGLHALGGPDIQLPVNAFGGSQTFRNLMGPAITPETPDAAGQFARRVGQNVGASLLPGMGIVGASETPVRAAAAQLGTALTSGAGAAAANAVAPGNPWADLAGQILGGGAFDATYKALQRAITPFSIDAQRAAFNDIMRQHGVELTAGQQTGNSALKYAESELGGAKAASVMDEQARQFTRAALAKAGVKANAATPEVMDKAFTDIGDVFDTLGRQNTLVPDAKFGSDLRQAVDGYRAVVSPTNQAPIVNSTIKDIIDYVKSGAISGAQYQDLRSRLNKAARATARTDPSLSGALFGIQNAMDDAMSRSIAQNNPPALGAWQQARQDYKNLLVIESAVGRAGEAAANGLITPGNLRAAVQAQNKRAYVRGKADLGDLARAGVATMTPLPNSGTAPRMAARNFGSGLMSTMGALAGSQSGAGLPGAAAGFALGWAAPYMAGRAILSNPGKAYLTNQLLPGRLGLPEAWAGPAIAAFQRSQGQ